MKNIEKKSRVQMLSRVILTFVSQFGSSVFIFALTLKLFAQNDDPIVFALNLIISPIVIISLSPVVGWIIDSYSHKKIVIMAQVSSIMASFVFLVYSSTVSKSLILASVLLIIVLKVSDEFNLMALSSSSIHFVLAEHQQEMKSYQQIAATLSSILSPLFGGVLFGILTIEQLIFFEIISEIIALIIVCFLNFEFTIPDGEITQKTIMDNSFKFALIWFKKQPYLKALVLLATIENAMDTVLYLSLPIIVLSILEMPNLIYSVLMTAMAVGEIVGGFLIAKKKKERPLTSIIKNMVKVSFLILGLAFIPFIKFKFLVVTLIGVILFTISIVESYFNIPLQVWYVTEIPSQLQGRIFSLISAIMSIGLPIATIVFTFGFKLPIQMIKLNCMLIMVAVFIKLITLFYYSKVKKIDFSKSNIL
ncbi:MFS transporter [Pseudolactococcus yaeyamensis]